MKKFLHFKPIQKSQRNEYRTRNEKESIKHKNRCHTYLNNVYTYLKKHILSIICFTRTLQYLLLQIINILFIYSAFIETDQKHM